MADAKNMKEYHGQIQEALDDKFLRATLDKFAVEYKANRTRIFSGMDVVSSRKWPTSRTTRLST